MTCKCGHLLDDHAILTDKYERQECFKCDCLKFEDSTKIRAKISEACEWNSCEHCSSQECQHTCHKNSTFTEITVPEEYQ